MIDPWNLLGIALAGALGAWKEQKRKASGEAAAPDCRPKSPPNRYFLGRRRTPNDGGLK